MRDRMGKGNAFVCVIAVGMCLIAMEVTAREEETTTATKLPNETLLDMDVLKVESSNGRTSDVHPNPECFCTYDQEKSLVRAHIGHKQLNRGDRIMRGETVTFECRYFGRVLLWKNSFRFFGKATMTCSTCTRWQSDDLPTCNYTRRVEPVIGCEEDLKILPGGIVDMRKGESRRFFCSNSLGQPQWDYGDRKDVSVNNTRDDGRGVVMFVSYLDIKQAEDGHSGRYECFKQSQYGRRFGSAFLNIQVNEALCSVPSHPVNGRVVYTSLEYGAELKYDCNPGFVLKKQMPRTCSQDGSWSNEEPECINRTVLASPATTSCNGNPPSSPNAIPVISSRQHGVTIWYSCRSRSHMKVQGNVTCHFGSWIGVPAKCLESPCFTRKLNYPGLVKPTQEYVESGESLEIRCELGVRRVNSLRTIQCFAGKWYIPQNPCAEDRVTCLEFPDSPGLEIRYSNNLFVGSIAEFSCTSSRRNMIGPLTAVCQDDGTWNNPLPSCEDADCSIEDLLESIDENVEPDMTGVTNEFMPSGSKVKLKCSGNLISIGNAEALCGSNGKWKLERYQCIGGCVLDIDPSSHLLVQPAKETYRFGDLVSLSCPPGEEMSNDVERIMCLGSGWSDSLPFCKE